MYVTYKRGCGYPESELEWSEALRMRSVGKTDIQQEKKVMEMQGSTMSEADYARAMIKHHQDAVTMSKRLLSGSPRPKIKAFAEKVIEVQSKEITWLKSWLQSNG